MYLILACISIVHLGEIGEDSKVSFIPFSSIVHSFVASLELCMLLEMQTICRKQWQVSQYVWQSFRDETQVLADELYMMTQVSNYGVSVRATMTREHETRQ